MEELFAVFGLLSSDVADDEKESHSSLSCKRQKFLPLGFCANPGKSVIATLAKEYSLLKGLETRGKWLLTHGDSVDKVAEGLRCAAKSSSHINSAIAATERRFNGVQFHPEADLTENGMLDSFPLRQKMLHNFLFDNCGLQGGFALEKREQQCIDYVRRTVLRNKIVLMLVIGGVDSAVCAALLRKALLHGDDSSLVHNIHIDNGFLRKDESEQVVTTLQQLVLNHG
ncbi:GMP synthase [glutamine-hydrolyzing]-like [Daphnia magna]|uniref:GMP synthase [glutamine-hydrolyzing]-like n=1 Tax=Daphnia magna TaxID=35525 RepID=UPI001E1BC2A2|nr:GMP synthase [glutamine-hydrolyzing]-like [Daphnia magna]